MIDPLVTSAHQRPGAIALMDASRHWTWRELLADANDLARRLRAHASDRIALLSRDTGAAVVAIHASRLAAATLVPLNRRLTVAELVPLLERSATSCLMHDASHADIASELAAVMPTLTMVPLEPLEPVTPNGPVAARPLDVNASGVVVFSSGTTGVPRGARLTYANLLFSARSWNGFLDARADDHWLAALPLSHVAGLGVVVRAMVSGARLTVHDRFDPTAVRLALATEGVTHISLVPTQLSRLLGDGPVAAPHLRALLLGGAPIPARLVERAVTAGLPIVTTYGMTEAASGVTALPANEARDHPGSSGRALPGVRIRVVLGDGTEAQTGIVGDVEVSGPSVFSGYDGDPEATEAVLRDGWLRTGDLGSLDADGRLTISGRRDDLIISGGENISPTEVEAVLSSHPDIADAAVVGRPDPLWGAVPVAAIVPRPNVTLGSAAIAAWSRERLAGYKVPVSIDVVDAIPRTASGKIIRRDVWRLLRSVATDMFVDRPDGARIHVRRRGRGPVLVLLHATLSNARELDPLAIELSEVRTVLAIDRRSAGGSVMPRDDIPGTLDVQVHIDDVLAVLDSVAPGEQVLVVGHSYGGCVGLEFAARHPERVAGVFLFEPPYLAVLPGTAAEAVALGQRITAIAEHDGLGAAALAFLETVNGPGISRRLPPGILAQFEREGRSAVADSALAGFEPAGLGAVRVTVHIGLGDRSRGPYAAVAGELRRHIASLETHHFPTLGHGGPISQPNLVATAILTIADATDTLTAPTPAPGGTP